MLLNCRVSKKVRQEVCKDIGPEVQMVKIGVVFLTSVSSLYGINNVDLFST